MSQCSLTLSCTTDSLRNLPRRKSAPVRCASLETHPMISRRNPVMKRSSFEIKQNALMSIQSDDTLERISALKHQPSEDHFWIRWAIYASPSDTSQKELIKRSTFLLISMMTTVAGVLWAMMYILLKEYTAALMPVHYTVCMSVSFFQCIFNVKGQFEVFIKCQLVLILLLPMAVHVALGGVKNSGGVILWSIICPIGATCFRSPHESLRWFKLYLVLTGVLLWINYGDSNYSNIVNEGKVMNDWVIKLYFTMNILGVAAVIFGVVFYFARELENEYNKSEEVLSNILPQSIIRRIKLGEFPIVDHIDEVSILFADLVGFTKASAEMHPNLLIGLFLRDVFNKFDELTHSHELEKIKTIGDAYMVVGGMKYEGSESRRFTQNHKQQSHSSKIMLLAGEMFSHLKAINHKYNLDFNLRIGVHIGPVVAGVLSLKRLSFDVWGDSVNTASRMESNGVPGHVHISSDMYEIVKNLKHFDFASCGETYIKGKGMMTTFLATPLKI